MPDYVNWRESFSMSHSRTIRNKKISFLFRSTRAEWIGVIFTGRFDHEQLLTWFQRSREENDPGRRFRTTCEKLVDAEPVQELEIAGEIIRPWWFDST